MANSSVFLRAIEFKADIPDDHLEEDGEITRASGINLSGAIVDMLRSVGVNTSKPSLDVEHDSWEFYAERAGRKFWLLVTDMGDKKLIQTRDASSFVKRIFNGNVAHADFLEILHSAMSADPRFSALQRVT